MRTDHLRLAWLVPLALVLVGCVGNKMYRTVSVVESEDYSLAFIEFDDQGEMWAPVQLSNALSVIERANLDESGAVLVTYFHGWQHNASPKNETSPKGNVHNFKRFLATIRQAMEQEQPRQQRPLVGIYLGWRGKSGGIPGLNFLTFYSRAGAARRIAGVSSTEVIYRLLVAAKRNPRTRAIVMGHSFGGQIVERAITQAMVGELLRPESLPEQSLPADLVVLINPAAKSIHAKQFVDLLERSHLKLYRTDRDGNRFPVPLMVSITSTADLATRWAFPLGTSVSSLGKNFHRYSEDACLPFTRQRSFYIRTPGHNKALISHAVTASPLPEGREPSGDGHLDPDLVETEFDPSTARPAFSFDGLDHRFTIRSIPGALNDSPYWIMRVPRALIPGHSGFFTADTLRLIVAIVKITGALEAESATEVVRRDGVRPTGIYVLGDGRTLVTDASRRMFRVEVDSPVPFNYGCIPQIAEPQESVGVVTSGTSGLGIRSRPTIRSSIRGGEYYKTDIVRFSISGDEMEVEEPIRVRSSTSFGAATYDFATGTIFLATESGGEIYRASLFELTKEGKEKEVRPEPEPLIVLSGVDRVSELLFFDQLGALIVADGESGSLYRVDGGAAPKAERLAEGLGWPVQLAADESRGRLFVADAKERRIWRLDCVAEEGCSEPSVLAQGEPFVSPSAMSVAADGTLWIGDLDAEKIVALSPEGDILQLISRLPAE